MRARTSMARVATRRGPNAAGGGAARVRVSGGELDAGIACRVIEPPRAPSLGAGVELVDRAAGGVEQRVGLGSSCGGWYGAALKNSRLCGDMARCSVAVMVAPVARSWP